MSFPLDQSPYGAFDLAGNVWEFTKDYYDPNYYHQFKGRRSRQPDGPRQAGRRPPQVVVKGGSKAWLASGREGIRVDRRFPFVGFRGVLPVEGHRRPRRATPGRAGPLLKKSGGIAPF